MSTVRCPKCDALVAGGSRFCTECGSALEGPAPHSATDIFTPPTCPDCGRSLTSGAVSCPDCSWRRTGASPEETPSAAPPTPPPAPEVRGPSPVARGREPEEPAPAPPIAPAAPPPPADGGTQIFVSHAVLDRGRVEHLLPDGDVRAVDFDAELLIGRVEGDLTLPDDPFVDDEHARIRRVGREFVVEDLDSVNGTFVRLSDDYELRPGDRVLLGGQIFEFVV